MAIAPSETFRRIGQLGTRIASILVKGLRAGLEELRWTPPSWLSHLGNAGAQLRSQVCVRSPISVTAMVDIQTKKDSIRNGQPRIALTSTLI